MSELCEMKAEAARRCRSAERKNCGTGFRCVLMEPFCVPLGHYFVFHRNKIVARIKSKSYAQRWKDFNAAPRGQRLNLSDGKLKSGVVDSDRLNLTTFQKVLWRNAGVFLCQREVAIMTTCWRHLHNDFTLSAVPSVFATRFVSTPTKCLLIL